MVRVSIGFVGQGDRRRPASPDQLDDRPHLLRGFTQLPVGQPEIHAPRGAEHDLRLLGFTHALLRRAVRPHFATRQIAEPDGQPAGNMMGHRAAHPDFEIVRMRSEDEQVDRRHRHSAPGAVLGEAR